MKIQRSGEHTRNRIPLQACVKSARVHPAGQWQIAARPSQEKLRGTVESTDTTCTAGHHTGRRDAVQLRMGCEQHALRAGRAGRRHQAPAQRLGHTLQGDLQGLRHGLVHTTHGRDRRRVDGAHGSETQSRGLRPCAGHQIRARTRLAMMRVGRVSPART